MECQFCKKTFSNKSNFKYHQKNTEYCLKIQNKKKQTFDCSYCFKELSSKQRKNTHENKCKIKRLNNIKEKQISKTLVSYIYLIREREFLDSNQNIYKIGRTSQECDNKIRRLQNYKKGSQIVLVIEVDNNNVISLETNIKREFEKEFTSHSDGFEYFEGNVNQMKNIMIKHILFQEKNENEIEFEIIED